MCAARLCSRLQPQQHSGHGGIILRSILLAFHPNFGQSPLPASTSTTHPRIPQDPHSSPTPGPGVGLDGRSCSILARILRVLAGRGGCPKAGGLRSIKGGGCKYKVPRGTREIVGEARARLCAISTMTLLRPMAISRMRPNASWPTCRRSAFCRCITKAPRLT